MGEQQQTVVLGEDPEESPEGHFRGEHEQADPQLGAPLHRVRGRVTFATPDDSGRSGSDDALQEILVQGLAGSYGHLVGGDPTLHRLVDGEPAYLSARITGKRAVRIELF